MEKFRRGGIIVIKGHKIIKRRNENKMNNMFQFKLIAFFIVVFFMPCCSCEGNGGGKSDLEENEIVDFAEEGGEVFDLLEVDREETGIEEIPVDLPVEDNMDASDIEIPFPPFPYTEVRGIIHLHSPYSHDACDGHGIVDGVIDQECLMQLRNAACLAGFDFVALTDHPANMQYYSMEEDLLYMPSEGDRLVIQDGEPVSNIVTCNDGHEILFTVGFESSAHSMPVCLHRFLSDSELYNGVDDSTPSELVERIRVALEEAGAVHSVVHSEGDDISPPRIIEAGFQAMEWTNLHAIFEAVLGGDVITGNPADVFNMIKRFEDFLLGKSGGPHADLIFLDFLPMMPLQGFEKWNEVQRTKPITGIIGTDAHRNVSIDPVCSGSWQTYCEILARLFPNTLTLLISGGSIVLSDGDRVDSYARMMRWVENRVFVTELTIDGLRDALMEGRSYALFSVFGNPLGFVFDGRSGERYISMGEEVSGPVVLRIKSPERPEWMGGAPFTEVDARNAMVRVVLKKIIPSESNPVDIVELNDLGESFEQIIEEPGSYYVEVWIRPFHLQNALAGHEDLASREYLYLITNPIKVNM